MAEVKWIKIVTDIFDDEKILLIESMPDRDSIIVIWFKLLCLAGKTNSGGVLLLNDCIPYTDEMLSTIFRRPLNTVRLALQTFEQFGMIVIVNDTITIPKWGKHQSLDRLESKKEYMREYMQDYRKKQREIACKTNSKTNVNLLDIEEDKERDKDIERDTIADKPQKHSASEIQSVFDMYHEICVSLPKVKLITEGRKTAVKAKLKRYSIEQIKEVFTKAEASDLLTGKVKSFKAGFDWIMKEANFAKIIEGNYDNRKAEKQTDIPSDDDYDFSNFLRG
jgi:predicted phage replisome organizer